MPTEPTSPVAAAPGARRLTSHLLAATIVLPGGRDAGHVIEARLSGGPGLQTYVVEGLVVGRRPQGSMLGYDRRQVTGPWLVRALVTALNRDLGYVPWHAVRRIDWDAGRVEVDRVEPLEDERARS